MVNHERMGLKKTSRETSCVLCLRQRPTEIAIIRVTFRVSRNEFEYRPDDLTLEREELPIGNDNETDNKARLELEREGIAT
jgi:hypothetical protein